MNTPIELDLARRVVETWGDGNPPIVVLARALISAAAERDGLRGALERAQIVLTNMAAENEGAIFNRWPINHEPLRSDARHLLPVIAAALSQPKSGEGEK